MFLLVYFFYTFYTYQISYIDPLFLLFIKNDAKQYILSLRSQM